MADRPDSNSDEPNENRSHTPTQQSSVQNDEPPVTNNEQSSSHPSARSALSGVEAQTAEAQPQTTSSNSSGTNQNAAPAPPFPVDPGAHLRSGAGGFAALVDAFMAGFRQAAVDARGERTPSSQPQTTTAASSGVSETNTTTVPASSAQNENTTETTAVPSNANNNATADSTSNDATSAANNNASQTTDDATDRPRTLFFRMPVGPDGRDALLAFTPGPIPIPPPEAGMPTAAGLSGDRGNGLASGFHLPHSPIFVPFGASPLHFSFLFDAQTNTAWPIANITNGPPGAMPIEQPIPPNMPQFVTGPPFRIALNVSYGPPPEVPRPDPERASRFVGSLERADAELRGRMARLGMGDIGDYGGSQNNEGGNGAALGCGICLDEYASEDRPEWIGGQSSIDEEVVAVPCAGHHTLHHRCLYEWLVNTPPSQWTCPFCRAPLDKEKVDQSASEQEQQRQQETRQRRQDTNENEDNLKKKAELEARARSLREEVRLRERARGWRCDSPACLPRYPDSPNDEKDCAHQGEESTVSDWPSDVTSLISLLPCRHKLHLDCLCTSMKLEQADLGSEDDSDEEEEEETEEIVGEAKAEEGSNDSNTLINEPEAKVDSPLVSKQQTVGKWVTCPTCRHEAWAELPVRRKPKRVESFA
ncbi:uncharacterized protein FA14DRAFT_78507 [Meira miltonrushii]|uniref:RING-type domain-containing protein n=1 Tax=Meira miltonrushii TaxID=1280837 RepID=A0A316VB95_9BASI|nr:uncharacterized protein FA14DRAFT_78507 [Meira miltonrushii]PWN32835.1 hypothetical protein FA14DRAFT_78507 [Meira miltonrushii]